MATTHEHQDAGRGHPDAGHGPGDRDGGGGTFFLFPPRHRLFTVFDDAAAGLATAAELRDERGTDDVWTFVGDKGLECIDPRDSHHHLRVAVVRLAQRLLTGDCEYCDGLSSAMRAGAVVLAVRVDEDQAEDLADRLADKGGRDFAYGEHWNFVPLEHATHAVGYASGKGASESVGV